MVRGTAAADATAARHTGSAQQPVRERILDAALAILHESGGRRLTQTAVARRAGIRQSHLTYYFPTREDLLHAVSARAVAEMTAGVGAAVAAVAAGERRRAGGGRGRTSSAAPDWLRSLAREVAAPGHMRLFLGMIAEADRDPAIRSALAQSTRQMEAAIAAALGGSDAADRARAVLASMWGFGVYAVLMGRSAEASLEEPFLSWLLAGWPDDRRLDATGR